MRGTIIRRVAQGARTLLRDQRGNAFMLTAAAVVPLIGIVGSAVDIGRAYMTQLRLQQACDAGVLAGRRAMAAGTYTDAAEAEADKMFNYNFPAGTYGSEGVTFSSQASGTSDVVGTASTSLPTSLMKIFGFADFDLAVNCTAKLEISNTDVMLVLDVTGSMDSTNSGDSVNRITALQNATMDFFDTLTNADMGDGRLRFGVVPYSSSANVGAILYAKDPDWLSDFTDLPSRDPKMKEVWEDESTVVSDDYTATDPVPDGGNSNPDWESAGTYGSANSKSKCNALEPWTDNGNPQMIDTTDQNYDQEVNGSTKITVYDSKRTYRYYSYRYNWVSSRWGGSCRIERLRWTFTRTYKVTKTEILKKVFDNKYTYINRRFPVADAKDGVTSVVTNVGDYGTEQSNIWGGCVIERQTADFDSDETAPDEALDMDVDTAPTSDDVTKWKLLIPEIAFARASHPSYSPSNTSKDGQVVDAKNVTTNDKSKGSWQNYSKYWADGWGVCPAPAMKLTTMTKADRSSFDTYIGSLKPLGGTYHDAGMVWGVRFLSPDGMFADENAEAPNKRPIGRHIVFMTDGQMAPNMGNLSFQGYEYLMHRVGGSDDNDLTSRHNNRFQQLCSAAKNKNITVWVVSFGTSLSTSLTNCASPGKAYQADDADALNENFQAIARQISKLRLSQ